MYHLGELTSACGVGGAPKAQASSALAIVWSKLPDNCALKLRLTNCPWQSPYPANFDRYWVSPTMWDTSIWHGVRRRLEEPALRTNVLDSRVGSMKLTHTLLA